MRTGCWDCSPMLIIRFSGEGSLWTCIPTWGKRIRWSTGAGRKAEMVPGRENYFRLVSAGGAPKSGFCCPSRRELAGRVCMRWECGAQPTHRQPKHPAAPAQRTKKLPTNLDSWSLPMGSVRVLMRLDAYRGSRSSCDGPYAYGHACSWCLL